MTVIGNLKKIPRKSLFDKVVFACEQIGIDDVVTREWDINILQSNGTNGCARQRNYDNGGNHYSADETIDIGYFERHSFEDDYTIGSFLINPLAFTPQRQEQFEKALMRVGLSPSDFVPGGMVYRNIEREKKIDSRQETALYRCESDGKRRKE